MASGSFRRAFSVLQKMADDEEAGYRWESAYEKTWETLREDESGALRPSVDELSRQAQRRHLLDRQANVRLGIMRYVFVVLDASRAMNNKDLEPSRWSCSLKMLDNFIDEFFDQNPISQLGFITTREKRAEKLTDLTGWLVAYQYSCQSSERQGKVNSSGNAKKHKADLAAAKDMLCSGEPSLQNALEIAFRSLKDIPSHTSREVVVLMASLTSCDPTNIAVTIEKLKQHRIQCSVIGLSAEIYICRRVCDETGGSYSVITDEQHFKDVLFSHALPPRVDDDADSNLLKMGFPMHKHTPGQSSFCVCHSDVNEPNTLQASDSGYFCPQCQAKYCSVPVECRICGLTLVTAPQLARSYHHLFPLEAFDEGDAPNNGKCSGCGCALEAKCYSCTHCSNHFCIDCDLLLHESLHICPTCDDSRPCG